MTRSITIKRHSFLAILVFGLTSTSYAAQLGRLEILSSADEPFRAEIAVESVTPSEEATLSAGLASVESFAAARLAMDPQLSRLSFNVTAGEKPGSAKVVIQSNLPLDPGFIDALVELKWAGGKVAREYTLTIPVRTVAAKEPAPQTIPAIKPPVTLPEIKPKQVTEVAKNNEPQVSASPKQSNEVKPPEPLVKEERAKQAEAPKPTPTKTNSQGQLTVTKGNTLSDIALGLVESGVTLNQAMAAVYDANRDAFINGSIHQLKQGAVLQIPNRSALRKNTPTQALIILALADDRNDFSAYARARGLLDGNGQPTVRLAQGETSLEAASVTGGQIGQAPERTATPAVQGDALKISPVEGSTANADAMAEEITAKEKALTEANERIALLEQNITDLQRLVEMQSGRGESGAATIPSAEGQPPAQEGAATQEGAGHSEQVPVSVPGEGGVKQPELETVAAPSHAEDHKHEEPKPAESKTTEETAGDSPAVEPKEQDHGGALGLMTSPWVLGGMGGLALLVLLLLLWKLRKKDAASEDDKTFAAKGDEQSADSFDEALAWASGTSAASAVKDEPAVQAIEDEVFDLDSVLSEDVAREEEVAPEPIADEVVAEEAQPEHELEPASAIEDNLPSVIDAEEPLTGEVDLDFPEEETDDSALDKSNIMSDLDDLEKGAEAAQAELDSLRKSPPADEDVDIEANFDDVDEIESSESEGDPELAEEEPTPDLEKAMEDLDLDMPNEVDEATWQEVATKLDLASAYVEIGDADGARELLEEIVARGDVDQVRKAKELLASLES